MQWARGKEGYITQPWAASPLLRAGRVLGVEVERVTEATSNVITDTACQLGDPRGETPLELVAPGGMLNSGLASRSG